MKGFQPGDQVRVLVGGPHENYLRVATVGSIQANGDVVIYFGDQDEDEWVYSPNELRLVEYGSPGCDRHPGTEMLPDTFGYWYCPDCDDEVYRERKAVRQRALEAAKSPWVVTSNLELTAEQPMTLDLAVRSQSREPYMTMQLPRDTGVRLRIHSDRMQLTWTRRRRWWQFWRPKMVDELLAARPYKIKAGDTVRLMCIGGRHSVTVNDEEIMAYPPSVKTPV